ncbi:serine/threonine protein kinase [Thermobifida cellulosilytica TB100]|uniref:non-specific serine/threonine protein kinase n=1 Tax=Thermobifida cellulosilytica TB100 TaxID=665004 RepID=A0A147KM84_THECS|nr:serine/threonine protein kinase [Thermobifida cellulosilytica TB100]
MREPIGRGGVGTVWRATDLVLDREVAVKELRLPDDLTEDERAALLRRTTREARVAGRLSHPNVVTVLDVVNEDGRPWIVMELVVARTLAEIIDIAGPLPYPRVAEIGLQLISALKAAHDEGIVHRDVKPENVMISENGRVVLTDFGLAAWTGESALSSSGRIIGSPSYLPPERAKAGPVGPPSDLWSLGATLYAAVEGHPPYDRKGYIAILRGDQLEEPAPAANAGPLAPVLAGLLKVNPDERLTAESATAMLRIASLAPWAPETSPETAARSAEAVRREGQEKLSAVDHFRAGAEVLRHNLHEQVSQVSDALQRHRPESVSALLTSIRESTNALGLTSSGKHRSEPSRTKRAAVAASAVCALLLLLVVLWALVFRG